MYRWSHSEPVLQPVDLIPGKLSSQMWPPVLRPGDPSLEHDINRSAALNDEDLKDRGS